MNVLMTLVQPPIPASAFGQNLLDNLGTVALSVLPAAAAFTGMVILLIMLKRWLGHITVTRGIGGSTVHFGGSPEARRHHAVVSRRLARRRAGIGG